MRMVVDSNYLRTKELRDWLAQSRRNVAVLTDQAEMEMAKADSLEEFLKSTEVLAEFPRQVVLAKPITEASGLRGKKKNLKKRLTDGQRTAAFRRWCRRRGAIKRGEKKFEIDEARAAALGHVEDILEGGAKFKEDLAQHAVTVYTPEELAIIRRGGEWNGAIAQKVIGGIMEFAARFYDAHPDWDVGPEARDVPYTFVFRYALCAYLHALHWIKAGGAADRKQEKFANDFVDVAIVAYATCFDGLFTNDKLARGIYDNARSLLDSAFSREDLMPKRVRKRRGQLQAASSR